MSDFEEYIRQWEPDKKEKGIIKYLRKLGFNDIGNDLFAQNSWYFRNALVRANYKNLKNNVYATTENTPNLLDKNGGVNVADEGKDGGVNIENSGVNGGVNLLQKQIIDFMQQNSQISVAEIAKQTNKCGSKSIEMHSND